MNKRDKIGNIIVFLILVFGFIFIYWDGTHQWKPEDFQDMPKLEYHTVHILGTDFTVIRPAE